MQESFMAVSDHHHKPNKPCHYCIVDYSVLGYRKDRRKECTQLPFCHSSLFCSDSIAICLSSLWIQTLDQMSCQMDLYKSRILPIDLQNSSSFAKQKQIKPWSILIIHLHVSPAAGPAGPGLSEDRGDSSPIQHFITITTTISSSSTHQHLPQLDHWCLRCEWHWTDTPPLSAFFRSSHHLEFFDVCSVSLSVDLATRLIQLGSLFDAHDTLILAPNIYNIYPHPDSNECFWFT